MVGDILVDLLFPQDGHCRLDHFTVILVQCLVNLIRESHAKMIVYSIFLLVTSEVALSYCII
jgi:hypothetical protein